MRLGDLVRYLDQHWLVSRYDPKRTRSATLLAASGSTLEVPFDHDALGGLVVVANPSRDWPFITVPPRNGYVVDTISFQGQPLEPFTQWVASDPTRPGGPVFLAPDPRLRYGEALLIQYVPVQRTGTGSRRAVILRVDITKDFGTVRQRVARVEAARPKVEEKKNAFTRLLADDPYGDE